MSTLSRSFSAGLLAVPMLLVSALAQAQAQPAGPRKITLDEGIQLALANNPALRATRTLIEQSRDEQITANLRPNPVLIADSLFVPLFSPGALTSDNINNVTEFDLGASYLFERGKKRQHRLQAARDATAVTTSQVADAERALTFSVAQQFIGALLAESSLEFARQDLASFQNTVDISQAQYKAGQISEGDFLKIKIQMLQFQTDVSSAQLARVQALVGLRQILGYQSVPADYDVSGTLAYQPLKLDREHLQALALQLRPDLRAAVQGVTASQSQYALARANGKPDLNFTFDYTHVSTFENGSFTINLPLAIFNRNQGEIARTQAAILQAQDSEVAARETVTTDISNTYEAVQANGRIVELYQSGYLDEARQSRDISQYAYQRGAASLLDLLDAERSYRAIQLAYLQAEASYQLALEQLREAVGTRRIP